MTRAAGISIRSFRSSDASFLLALSRAAFGEFSRDGGRSTLWLAEHWTCFVAEVVGTAVSGRTAPIREPSAEQMRAVGFVVLKLERERGELAEVLAIAVLERERGRGFGRALLDAAERRARAAGASGILLHTAEANLAAFELFVKSGYALKRRISRYYVDMYDACEMQKTW